MTVDLYTCECCKSIFELIRPAKEAENEYKELFPDEPDRARVCETCFIKIMKHNEPGATRYLKYVSKN